MYQLLEQHKSREKSFFWKLASKAFCQVLLHQVSECTWDSATQTVTSPHAKSEMAAVAEFESQDWVQDLLQATSNPAKEKTFVNPNAAFPFQDDFSVGTIHGVNAGTNRSTAQQAGGGKSNNKGAIEILDNKDNNEVSVLTSKTQDELVSLLVQARRQLSSTPVGSRVASSSDTLPGIGPVAMQPQINVGGQEPTLANGVRSGTEGNNVGGIASNRPGSK